MPHRRPFVLLLLLLALAAAARPSVAQTELDPHGPAMIVLDGSGSMWGTIEGERPVKFELARQALSQSLSALSPAVRLGLLSFGQRRRADCSDVEVLAAPEAGPPERILAIAEKISPKGKGPLSLALREAARAMPAGEPGSIIAIHDGPDNCGQDICATAAALAKANPGLRIFLIGFGPDAEPAAHQCVAKATNGKVLQAGSSTELATAVSDALMLANLERVDPATGMAVPVPKAATPPPPAGPPGLKLSAALTPDGKPLSAAIAWTIARAEASADVVKSARTKELSIDLSPGAYVVEARLGQVTKRQTVEVADGGPTVVKFSLDAGVLNLKAQADRDGKPLANPVVTIFDKNGGPQPVWIGREAVTQLVLPAGDYRVRVEDGLAAETSEVSLAAGAGVDAEPVLGTGQLSLVAVPAADGEPLEDVTFTVTEDDPDSPAGRREVARSADTTATFILPAGTYYVTARAGAGETNDRIALGSGASIRHEMILDLVPLTVVTAADTGQSDDGGEAAGTARQVVIRVLDENGRSPEIARRHGPSGSFQLPPARYRIEAEIMGRNVKAAGIVDLRKSRGGSVQLKLEHGEVSVDPSAAPGRRWRIKDSDGRTVLHAGHSGTATAQLAPGHYVLTWDAEGGLGEQPFDLKTGERRRLKIGTP